jgi:hypothetical protein
MRLLPYYFALTTLATALPALALDANCALLVDATEKTAQQPARQSITDLGGGQRMEAIVIDGVLYSKMSGKWMKLKADFRATELALAADMRNGAIKLEDCKNLGNEAVDGINTTVIEYTLKMPGADAVRSKIYIGKDGLIYALAADDTKVRQRFVGVTTPKL